MAEIKDKASRIRQLMRDETFKDVMQEVKDKQIAVFLNSSAKIEHIEEAHALVKALDEIERHMQSVLDDEAVYDKKHS